MNYVEAFPAPFQAVRVARYLGLEWRQIASLERGLIAAENRYASFAPEDVQTIKAEVEEMARTILRACESPIEELFIAELCCFHVGLRTALVERGDATVQFERFGNSGGRPIFLRVAQQLRVGGFRIDVLLHGAFGKIVVELDGHEFHERTKDQATRDKSRDRALLEMGLPVVRFTGSEVWANPTPCVAQCLRLCLGEEPNE